LIKNKLLVLILTLAAVLTTTLVNAQEPFNYNEHERRYVYSVSYKKLSIGKMVRELQWTDNQVKINMFVDLSFLALDFGGSQFSNIYWDEDSQLFITKNFIRESKGFSNVKMKADFSEKGHHSTITNNGKTASFSNQEAPIVDFNAITLQISEGLVSGKVDFEFFMQTSDDIAHYFFKVISKEVVKTKFGEFETYRVEQVKKNDRTFIAWFAPDMEHQMVKFHYQRKLLDIRGELTEHSTNKL
jgi:hypothetical protein